MEQHPPAEASDAIRAAAEAAGLSILPHEMRPLLKAWLDQHLPGMVEHIVKAEIARLMGGGPG